MNPYIENVLDVQRDRAFQNWERTQLDRNAQATAAGQFDAGRHGVVDALAEEELQRQLNEIDAQGLNRAWDNAQGMFTSDQGRMLQAGMANQGAGLTAGRANLEAMLQTGLANQAAGMTAQQLNQAAGLQTQQMGEASRQFGANYGLEGLAQQWQAQLGAGQGMLGAQSQLDRSMQQYYDMLNQQGAQRMAYDQSHLDLAYNDFVNQRDAERQNLNFYNAMLQGIPIQPNQDVQNSQSGSPLAALLGTGVAAYANYAGQT